LAALIAWFTETDMAMGYSLLYVLENLFAALLTGLFIGYVYRKTHRGLSYSQSLVITLVLMCLIVCSVMMVIGSNLARAFALVGALTIVRFRTVVKDTRDTAFIFFALTEGIACGTANIRLALLSTIFISLVAWLLARTNYGSMMQSEFILRFRYDREGGGEEQYVELIRRFSRNSTLIHVEPAGDGRYLVLTYDIRLTPGTTPAVLATSLNALVGVDSVNMVSSCNDVEY